MAPRALTQLLFIALLVVLAAALLRGGRGIHHGGREVARVVRVVDGDTIAVRLHGRRERVRYIGVDTPESVKPGTPVECFAHAASDANARLVAGRRVRLVLGRERRDRYGRLLAYVYRVSDGRFVNAELVRDGYAHTLTIPPNDRFAARFAALQALARRHRRGLWRACPLLAERYGLALSR
jgi:micrococcal nuclease